MGQKGGAKACQGKDQGIKAGKGSGKQQVTKNTGANGESGACRGGFEGGWYRSDQGIEEGNDPQQFHTLQNRPLYACAQEGDGGIERPFDDGFIASKHGRGPPS